MKPFWMVLGRGEPVYRHDTEVSAREEAERLARLHKNQTFVVLKAIAQARIPEPLPEWLTFDDQQEQPPEHSIRCRCPNCEAERPF